MQSIGKPFTELAEVDSTNNYAMAKAQNGSAKHGEAWFAHRQTAGKGSRGKSWAASAGENLLLTVLLEPGNLLISQSFYLTASVALAARDLFLTYATDGVSIKWPNDIYWGDRKAAGILIENSFRGQNWQWSVAGVGMNINQTTFDPALPNPVSLKQITGTSHPPVALAKELCDCLQTRYEQMEQNKASILTDYNAVLYKRGEKVKLKKENALFTCRIKGVTGEGLLETQSDIPQQFTFGEVQWVLPERNVL